jgi:hypothetical protein
MDSSPSGSTRQRSWFAMWAASTTGGTRRLAAGSPQCPVDILGRLGSDPEPDVRLEVARNPSSPPALLQTLLRDPDEQVQRTAAGHPRLPRYILAMWQLVHSPGPGPGCQPSRPRARAK